MTIKYQPLLFVALGFAVWLFALSLFYALISIGCARGWDQNMIGPLSSLRILLFLSWAAFFPVLAGIYYWCKQRFSKRDNSTEHRFLWQASAWSTVAATAGVAWIGAVILFSSLCI